MMRPVIAIIILFNFSLRPFLSSNHYLYLAAATQYPMAAAYYLVAATYYLAAIIHYLAFATYYLPITIY